MKPSANAPPDPVLTAAEMRDVDRRTIELKQSNIKLEALIDASPSAIICLDAEQRVILWNTAAEQLFGCAAIGIATRRPCPISSFMILSGMMLTPTR